MTSQSCVETSQKEYSKCPVCSFFQKIGKLKYWPLLLCLLILVVVYLSYFAFAIWQNVPNVELYKPGEDNQDTIWHDYEIAKAAVSAWNEIPLQIVAVCSLSIVVFVTLYLLIEKKMTWKKAAILIMITGAILRITYGLYSDNITTRQQDVWRGDGYHMGHFDITMYIFKNFSSPDPIYNVDGSVDFTASYQWYHPKLAHWTYAMFMRFNSLFVGDNTWVVYQTIRILTITLSIMEMYVMWRLIQELDLSNRGKLIMLTVVTFCPMFYRLSAMSNNDPMVVFFMILSIYFAVRWYKNHSFFNIVIVAISIGLAMECKLSGVIIAIPVAFIFLVGLINTLKNRNQKDSLKISTLIWQFVCFAAIVFPIGLFHTVYAYIKYDQPIVAVWLPTYSSIVVPNRVSFASKYLWFDFQQYFQYPFIQLQLIRTNSYVQDNNLYDLLLKSPLFGEFSYNNSYITFAYIMQYSIFILAVAFVALSIFDVVLGIIKGSKNLKTNKKFSFGSISFWLMAIIFFTFYFNIIMFTTQYKYVCSYDFRYIVPIIIPFGYFIAKGIDSIEKTSNPTFAKPVSYCVIAILSVFIIASSTFYILIAR